MDDRRTTRAYLLGRDAPEVKEGRWFFNDLFVNGYARPRTRLPRHGCYRFSELREGRKGIFSPVTSCGFSLGQIKSTWHNLTDVELVAANHWFETHLPISSVDEETKTVTFAHRSIGDLIDEKQRPARFWLENVLEAMTDPGDWYLDRRTGELFYLPNEGESPEQTEVIAPFLTSLVRFEGSRSHPVRHVRLENLSLCHAHWQLPSNNCGAAQAAFNVPGAVILRGTDSCGLYGCEISGVSQYGIEVQGGSRNTRIASCHIHDTGAGGIRINSERPLTEKQVSASGTWTGFDVTSMGWGTVAQALPYNDEGLIASATTITDCSIHDGGRTFPSAVAVWVGDAGFNRIELNRIFNFPYTAISVGWTWGYEPGRAVANQIKYNHIHHIGSDLLSDLGGIYLLGPQPGTTVCGNLIHDIQAHGYGGWGIYLDEGSSNVVVEDNLTFNTRSGGCHIHYGRDNLVQNNVFAYAKEEQIRRTRRESVRSWVVRRNIVVHDTGKTVIGTPDCADFEDNLYWTVGGSPSFESLDFDQWQFSGQDQNGLVADPLLTHPRAGAPIIRADSPALSRGMRFPQALRAGPRHMETRPASFDEIAGEPSISHALVDIRLETGTASDFWQDRAAVKPLKQSVMNFLSPDRHEPICLMVINRGTTTMRGTVKLVCEPANAAQLHGGQELTYDLEPGERASLDCAVGIVADFNEVRVEARCMGPTSPADRLNVATLLYFRQQTVWKVPELTTVPSLLHVPDAMPDAARRPFAVFGRKCGEIRMAASGDRLIVHLSVDDHTPQRSSTPGEGSGCELMFAAGKSSDVRRFTFLPSTDRQPAELLRMKGAAGEPAKDIEFTSWNRPGGYEAVLSIPLSEFEVAPGAKELLFEAMAAVSLRADGQLLHRISLFGNADPYYASGYATLQL